MLTLKQLKHLRAIMRYGSVHRAAETLHITQPALTRSLATLEGTLGVRLFDRSKGGMQATAFCLSISARSSALLDEADELLREAELYRNLASGNLVLGLGRAYREQVLHAALPAFVKAYPAVRIQIGEGTPAELIHGLKARQYDLVIAGSGSYVEVEGLVSQHLASMEMRVFVRQGHPLLGQGALSQAQLFDFPLLSTTELAAGHPFRRSLSETQQFDVQVLCSDYRVLGLLLLDSDAWLVAPLGQFDAELSCGELVALDTRHWGLVSELSAIELSGRSRSPAAQRFVDFCQLGLGTG